MRKVPRPRPRQNGRASGKPGCDQTGSAYSQAIEAGLDNLLFRCMGLERGMSLTIVGEENSGDYYSASLADAIAAYARSTGVQASVVRGPLMDDPDTLPPTIATAIESAEHLLFVSRIGDQLRFSRNEGRGTRTMCYALDERTFATRFCSADYLFFVELMRIVNAAIWGQKEIVITCPAGTRLVGTSPPEIADSDDDVTLKRFPMTVFRPVPANTFSGTLAISRWLCTTGSRLYRPDSAVVSGIVQARIENGRIVGFDGARSDVQIVQGHYDYVARTFDLDRDAVHSWHAGFHPHNGYEGLAADNLARWSGTIFGNPRYLHAHTCGDYAPGEICISVFDPTVTVDGEAFWCNGRFTFAQKAAVQALMDRYTGIRELYDRPVVDIGLGDR